MEYPELMEMVFQEYKRSFDLEVALAIMPMSDETRARLKADTTLAAMCMVAEAQKKRDILEGVDGIAFGADVQDGVRLSALDKLGKMLYPKRFKEGATGPLESGKTYRITYEEVEASA